MDLKIEDIMRLIPVSENTLIQWIKERKIPAYKLKNQYYFNRAEIEEWILKNRINVSKDILHIRLTEKPVSLIELLDQGGVHYEIEGKTVEESIKNAVSSINIPQGLTREDICIALIQREEMMPTAVGKGIAFPHPRCPVIADADSESLSICFLNDKIDYNALDKEYVDVLFIIISSNSRRHLEILSKVSFLCQQNDFVSLLHSHADEKSLRAYIKKTEEEWARGNL
jgi:PTS system nitrogen regulatory IIA component